MTRPSIIILILEDESALQNVIKSKLETENFSVLVAKTADQAFDYLESGAKVAGIWIDHYLAGSNSGLDFVTQLKKNKQWKDLPVFVVSNLVDKDKIKQYYSLGVQKCFTKVDNRLDTIIEDIGQTLGTKNA